MAGSAALKLAFALFVCMVVAAPHAEAAINCGTVSRALSPCMPYIMGKGPLSRVCCGGVKSLNSMAATPADRKAACGCLKSASTAISGINYSLAGGLPGKCGVNIPYKISPSTDCSRVN